MLKYITGNRSIRICRTRSCQKYGNSDVSARFVLFLPGIEYAAKIQSESAVVKRWNEYMKDVMYMPPDEKTGAQPLLTRVFDFN